MWNFVCSKGSRCFTHGHTVVPSICYEGTSLADGSLPSMAFLAIIATTSCVLKALITY